MNRSSWDSNRAILSIVCGLLVGFSIFTGKTAHDRGELLKTASFNEKAMLSYIEGRRFNNVTQLEKHMGIEEWKSSDHSKFKRVVGEIKDGKPVVLEVEGSQFHLTTDRGILVVEQRREVGTTQYFCYIVGFNLKMTD